jgi:hypothetical protein
VDEAVDKIIVRLDEQVVEQEELVKKTKGAVGLKEDEEVNQLDE